METAKYLKQIPLLIWGHWLTVRKFTFTIKAALISAINLTKWLIILLMNDLQQCLKYWEILINNLMASVIIMKTFQDVLQSNTKTINWLLHYFWHRYHARLFIVQHILTISNHSWFYKDTLSNMLMSLF